MELSIYCDHPNISFNAHCIALLVLSSSSFKMKRQLQRDDMGGLGFKCSSFSKFGFISLPCASHPALGGGKAHLLGCQLFMCSLSFYLVAESGLGGEEVIKGAHYRNGHKNCTCPYSNKNGCVTCFNIHFLNI